MGKKTGFLEYPRRACPDRDPVRRIGDCRELHQMLPSGERRNQAARCMDCGVPFCQAAMVFDGQRLGCPLHNLIPEWNDALYQGNLPHALSRLLKTSPFPEFTGRVCPALCERACTCSLIGQSVTIRENELYLIETAFRNGLIQPQKPEKRSDKRVAVVGSGPAGLSAAYYLNRRGHWVTVLERDLEPGGLLTYGIPEMKLPCDVVRRRIQLMREEGVSFQTGVQVGRDVTMEQLEADYDCVLLCCGAQEPRRLKAAEGAAGVVYALDFLKASAQTLIGEILENPLDAAGKRVVVVGAGDSASDCIAAALRQGCADIAQLIRKPASAYSGDPDYAHQEAQAVLGRDIRRFETQVTAVISDEPGKMSGLALSGPDGEAVMEADLLIVASGFSGSDRQAQELKKAAGPDVLLAGDMENGPSLVVLAIADGRRAAAQADTRLMGYTNIL